MWYHRFQENYFVSNYQGIANNFFIVHVACLSYKFWLKGQIVWLYHLAFFSRAFSA